MAFSSSPFGLLGGFDPMREFRRLQEEMDRLMGAFRTPLGEEFPAVNVYASQDGIAVLAELPGVSKDDLDIEAHEDALTLRGSRRPAAEKDEAYHRRERWSGAFARTLRLPYRIDPERVEAHLEDGVLRLSLPRPEAEKPRRIAIR